MYITVCTFDHSKFALIRFSLSTTDMPRIACLLCLLVACCIQVLAQLDSPTSDQYCVYAIYSSFSNFAFSDDSSTRFTIIHDNELSGNQHQGHQSLTVRQADPTTQCTVTSEVMSIYASAKLYCTTEETTSGFDYLRETCELSGIEMMSLDNITATATDSYVRSLQVIDPSILSPGMAITQAVVLSPSYYVLALRTLKDDEEIVPVDSHFGYALSGFWAIVLVIGMMNKLWNVVFKHRFANAKSTFPLLATAHHLYRTHLQLPATFGSHHQRLLFWCTIPTRLESFVIFSWWAINIILNCPRIDAFVGSTDGGTVSMQVWEYVGYRSGWLAIATLPWIWMFAGRNNIFIWVTGWSFGTFNIFHRHVARAATLQAIVHGISYTVLYVEAGKYYSVVLPDYAVDHKLLF